MPTFREAIRTQEFTLTAELFLKADTDARTLVRHGALLANSTDAIQLSDNPTPRVHMSPLAAASLLIQQGIDPVMQLTCRDRNRLALQSELLGASALGITSLLLMRGDRVSEQYHPTVKPVFDLRVKDLIALARAVRDHHTSSDANDFLIGAIATVFDPAPDWKPEGLIAKVDAGAQFVQTRVCMDVDVLRRYMNHLVAARLIERVHLIVGVAPLPSAEAALELRQNQRGAVIPDRVVERLRQSRDAEQEGVKICVELLQKLAEIPGVSGANVLSVGDPATTGAAILASGLRER